MSWNVLREELDRQHDGGRAIRLWLRDDDAVMPSPALSRLAEITGRFHAFCVVAVIPSQSGQELAGFLETAPYLRSAVHGWSHANHAPPGSKKQELGGRPLPAILSELSQGLAKLNAIHGDRFLPMLVPPWNRIDASLIPHLPALGFKFLSTFGHVPEASPVPMINTHVDLIDWRGTRKGRDHAALVTDLVRALRHDEPIGILSHHLVNDDSVFGFIEDLLALTTSHPACRWLRW